jgi:hypothetical protein
VNDGSAAIPAELRALDQWLIWREEPDKNGRPTKVPYRAARPGWHADTSKPDTWAPFDRTLAAHRAGRSDGPGFVVTGQDPYTGVDMDGCVTDGVVDPAAAAIVAKLDTYAELSPSGTGLRLIGKAKLNGSPYKTEKTPWRNGDRHEFATYDRGRYFTITGRHLEGTPTEIRDFQEQLDAVRAELLGPTIPEATEAAAAIKPGTLDPDRLKAACENDQAFNGAWERKGPKPRNDSSPSGWCLKLADLAVRAEWSDPDTAGLLIAYRAKHGDTDKPDDWYARTIARAHTARRQEAEAEAAAEVTADAVAALKDFAREPDPDPDLVLATFNRLTPGLQAKELLQQGDDAESARFALVTTDDLEIEIGTSKQLFDPDRVATAIYAKTHGKVTMMPVKHADWRLAVRGLGKAVRYIQGESEDEETRGWVQGYLAGRIAEEAHWNDAAYAHQPFYRDGCPHLTLRDLHFYVRRKVGEAIKQPDLQRRIARIGFVSEKVNCGPPGGRGNETSRTVWRIPEERLE